MTTGEVIALIKAFGGSGGGSGGGVLVVNVTEDGVCDKTWQEIHDAFVSTGVVFSIDGTLKACDEVGLYARTQNYYVTVSNLDYLAATTSDYPVRDDE